MGQLVQYRYGSDLYSFNTGGWFNATEAAARFGKRPIDWLRQDDVRLYMQEFGKVLGSTVNESTFAGKVSQNHFGLVRTRRGGAAPGTWLHPKLAVRFAQWLDVKFAVWFCLPERARTEGCMKPAGALMRRPFARRQEKGLAQRVAESLGRALGHGRKSPTVLRSRAHRMNVAALGCLITGQPAQACHVNFGKGLALKVCDSLCFPLSPEEHREHDQGGMPHAQRLWLEWEYVNQTRALLIGRGQWPEEVEQYYQRAVAPLRRMVAWG